MQIRSIPTQIALPTLTSHRSRGVEVGVHRIIQQMVNFASIVRVKAMNLSSLTLGKGGKRHQGHTIF